MNIRELFPVDGRKSFCGKAFVVIENDGSKTLVSYGTEIVRKNPDGSLTRLWDGWSQTTGRHIYAFCGLRKSEFFELDFE